MARKADLHSDRRNKFSYEIFEMFSFKATLKKPSFGA